MYTDNFLFFCFTLLILLSYLYHQYELDIRTLTIFQRKNIATCYKRDVIFVQIRMYVLRGPGLFTRVCVLGRHPMLHGPRQGCGRHRDEVQGLRLHHQPGQYPHRDEVQGLRLHHQLGQYPHRDEVQGLRLHHQPGQYTSVGHLKSSVSETDPGS